MTGERLCSTGHPITPTVLAFPSMRAGARSPKAGGLVEQELVVVRAELVVTVATAQHVVEVANVRGVQRGLAIGVGGSPACSRVLYGLCDRRSEAESCPSGVGSSYRSVASIPRVMPAA